MSAMERAQAVAASLNASLRQKRTDAFDQTDADAARRRDPDATDFHATIPINDYPQKARWRVTNKETMVQLIENTGASVTNKGTVWGHHVPFLFEFDAEMRSAGVFYEKGKDPGPDDPPKLHLLIESNDEHRVCHGHVLVLSLALG
jgi:ATP-dependent RNA helicase DDX46/PRP5